MLNGKIVNIIENDKRCRKITDLSKIFYTINISNEEWWHTLKDDILDDDKKIKLLHMR